jgi:hypothetical protein
MISRIIWRKGAEPTRSLPVVERGGSPQSATTSIHQAEKIGSGMELDGLENEIRAALKAGYSSISYFSQAFCNVVVLGLNSLTRASKQPVAEIQNAMSQRPAARSSSIKALAASARASL